MELIFCNFVLTVEDMILIVLITRCFLCVRIMWYTPLDTWMMCHTTSIVQELIHPYLLLHYFCTTYLLLERGKEVSNMAFIPNKWGIDLAILTFFFEKKPESLFLASSSILFMGMCGHFKNCDLTYKNTNFLLFLSILLFKWGTWQALLTPDYIIIVMLPRIG